MVEGYKALGRELYEQLDGRVDAVCLYVGTAGCYLGTTRALRERLPDLHRVAIEPAEKSGAGRGHRRDPPHRGRRGRVHATAAFARRDRRGHGGPTPDAFAMARRAAREDGIWSGPSTGANLIGAFNWLAVWARGHEWLPSRSTRASSTSPASCTPERRSRSARHLRSAAAADRPAGSGVYRLLRDLLPVR